MKNLVALLVGLAFVGMGTFSLAQPFEPFTYAVHIPDDKIPTIDGDLSDWDWVPDEYVITTWNQVRYVEIEDADDLSWTAIIGWNGSTGKLYVACHVHDSQIRAGHNWAAADLDDLFNFVIDAGNVGSGGFWGIPESREKEGLFIGVIPLTDEMVAQGAPLAYDWTADWGTWWYSSDPTYLEVKGKIESTEATELYYELGAVPFYPWNVDSRELSTQVMLTPGMFIGGAIQVYDADPGINLKGEDSAVTDFYRQTLAGTQAERLVWPSIILVPPEEVAVSPTSWGLIKSLLR